jgi:sulfatase maturation enzyme AslB (radical SAM superfamily)
MEEDIDMFLDEIAVREKGIVSTLNIMGGEVWLKFDLLQYAVDRAFEMDHQFGVSVTTNGTCITGADPFLLKQFVSKISSLEISWDGSGHDRRVFPNNVSSKPIVHRNMLMLTENGIPFRISYTAHKDNYKNLLYDMVHMMEIYKPKEIKISFACQEFSDMGIDYKKIRQDFLPYAEKLYMSYGIPICDLNCEACLLCDPKGFIGRSYMSPTTGLTYEEDFEKKKFDRF